MARSIREVTELDSLRKMIVRVINAQCVAILVLAVSVAAPPISASPLTDLPGRWSGRGSIKMSNGNSEQLKCVATYFVAGGGSSLQQNLRCASMSYKIDSRASLQVNGGRVSGERHEKLYSVDGSVAGRITGNGFNLAIQGGNFSAEMSVTASMCKQSLTITPRGFDIAEISMVLGKC
jgi:hypothetical protein